MSANPFAGETVRLAVFDYETDAALLARWNQNSEFQQLLDTSPAYLWTPKQIRQFMEKDSEDQYHFAIRTVADDRIVGFIGLSVSDWVAGNSWVGIGIGERDDWGKGYGTEAMQLLLRYAFAELNLQRVSLTVFGYNPRGLRSYQKCGFQEEGRARQYLRRGGERYDMIYMGVLREDWLARQPQPNRSEG